MWAVVALDEVDIAVQALPADLLAAFAELRAALEASPETVGRPFRADNADGGMRIISVGPDGKRLTVVFGVITRDRWVTLLQLTVLPTVDGQ